MPELTITSISLLGAALAAGLIVGWILRARRCRREKVAVNAGWQAQIDSQQSEHDRLAGQNKSLMEQISQYQASNTDTTARAKELSDALKDVTAGRDDLQRQLKDVRNDLEIATAKRKRLREDLAKREAMNEAGAAELERKDEKILRLNNALKEWQDRVPPLVARFRERDEAAARLSEDLQQAQERIAELEAGARSGDTRIEQLESEDLPPHLTTASNESHDDTAATEITRLQGHLAADSELDQSGASQITRIQETPADAGDDTSESQITQLQGQLADDARDASDEPADADPHGAEFAREDQSDAPESRQNADDTDAADEDAGAAALWDLHDEPGDTAVLPPGARGTAADPAAGTAEDSNDTTEAAASDADDAGEEDAPAAAFDADDAGAEDAPAAAFEADDAREEDRNDETAAVMSADSTGEDGREDEPLTTAGAGWATDTRVELTTGNWWENVPEPGRPGASAGLADGHGATSLQDSGVHTGSFDVAANELHDDLKLIKGVGPAIEKTLNDLGICRFNQIAEISEYDIDRVAQHLRGFRSRIYREDWIGQARSLHYRKNNGPG